MISPENSYNKLLEFAVQAGASEEKLKPCIADPKTQDLVRQSMAEGKAMDVTSTPTSFVDGRRMIGPNQEVLEQYIQYDSAHPAQ